MRMYPIHQYKDYDQLYDYLKELELLINTPRYLNPLFLTKSIFKLASRNYSYNTYIRLYNYTLSLLDRKLSKATNMYLQRKVKSLIAHLLYLQGVIDKDYLYEISSNLGIKYERIRHYIKRIIPICDRFILEDISRNYGGIFYLTSIGSLISHAVSSAITEHYLTNKYNLRGYGGILIGLLTGFIIGDGGVNVRRYRIGYGFRNYIYDYKGVIEPILSILKEAKVINYKVYKMGTYIIYSRIFKVRLHDHIIYKNLRIREKIGFILGLLLSDGYIYKQNKYAIFYQALSLRKRVLEPTIIDLIEIVRLIIKDLGGEHCYLLKENTSESLLPRL